MKKKILLFALIIVLLACASLAVLFAFKCNRINDEYEVLKADTDAKLYELSDKVISLENENRELDGKLKTATEENDELKNKLDDAGEYYVDIIADKDEMISELGTVNDGLKKEISKIRDKKDLDLTEIADAVNELVDYIQNSSPIVRVELTDEEIEKLKEADPEDEPLDHVWYEMNTYYEEGKNKLGEKFSDKLTLNEVLAETKARAPEVAVYYKNLSTGFVYTYNADTIFDSASVMKAPYIMSVLEACERYERGEIKSVEGDERYTEEKLSEMFDLDATIVIDHETMDVDGSGVLKDAEDGETYSFTELIRLALSKSDNIAFNQIKKRFTNKWYYDMSRKLGVKSPMGYEMNLSAHEAGILFEELYYFTLTNKNYGTIIRESLSDSAHSVLAKSALGGLDVAHKYGWDIDAYNDAAIVYGDKPFIAVVFTDMDCGGKLADEFIREIFKKIYSMHNTLS